MLINNLVLDCPKRDLLLDKTLRPLDIARCKYAGRQPNGILDDHRQVLDSFRLFAGELDTLLLLRLEPVGKVELDNVARMFEIARKQHDVERRLSPGDNSLKVRSAR